MRATDACTRGSHSADESDGRPGSSRGGSAGAPLSSAEEWASTLEIRADWASFLPDNASVRAAVEFLRAGSDPADAVLGDSDGSDGGDGSGDEMIGNEVASRAFRPLSINYSTQTPTQSKA